MNKRNALLVISVFGLIAGLLCFSGSGAVFGQGQPPAQPPSAEQPPKPSVKEEVEYFITAGGRKVGQSATSIAKVNYQNIPAYEITTETQFIREIASLNTQRFIEKSYVKEDDLTVIESNITVINQDDKKTVYQITRSEGKLVLVINPQIPEKTTEEMSGEVYLPGTLGLILLQKELIPGKVYPILFFQFSPILHDPQPVEMEVRILKKVVEKIMKKDTEGYYGELVNPDPLAGLHKITFFMDTKGLFLKQACEELGLMLEVASPEQIDIPRTKMAFEKKDRRDPFQPVKEPQETDEKNKKTVKEDRDQCRLWVKIAEDDVRAMKETAKTPAGEAREKALMSKYTKFSDVYAKVMQTSFDDMKARMTALKTEADEIMKGTQDQTVAEAKKLHAICMQAFDRRNWNELAKNADALTRLLDAAGIRGSVHENKINEYIKDVKELQRRAANITEFLNTAPRPSGRIDYTEDKDVKTNPLAIRFFGSEIIVPVIYRTHISRPAVLIGGKFYQEKDYIVPNTLQIITIAPDGITYIYKGEEIKIPLVK